MNYLIGILYSLVAQVITYIQLQGGLRYQWIRDHTGLMLLLGVPLAWLYMKSVHYLVAAGDGEIWPSRLIGFGVGIIVFTAMSWIIFKEPVTIKTIVSLVLSILIVLIQIYWK